MSHLVKDHIGPSSNIDHVLNVRFIELHDSSQGMKVSSRRVFFYGSRTSHTKDASLAIHSNSGTGNVDIVDPIGKFRGNVLGTYTGGNVNGSSVIVHDNLFPSIAGQRKTVHPRFNRSTGTLQIQADIVFRRIVCLAIVLQTILDIAALSFALSFALSSD
jgi:hypothetical protein